jgi:hypothetical protein
LPQSRLVLVEAAHRAWEEATDAYSNTILSWFTQ